MHELSLALEVGRLVEEEMLRTPGRLVRVGLLVGQECGVEPANLAFCLEAVLAYPPFSGAPAIMQPVDGDILRLDFVEIDDGRPDD